MVFIQESKVEQISDFDIMKLWPLHKVEYSCAPASGSAGGLISIWNSEVFSVSEKHCFGRFIATIGILTQSNTECGFVNVYAPSTDADKIKFLEELKQFLSARKIPWCLGGDFNLVLDPEEKMGFSCNLALINAFRSFVNEVGVRDLPLMGGKFTWSNHREHPTFVRLDRFLLSPDFELAFPGLIQKVLEKSLSDHKPIVLEIEKSEWGQKPFKCFNFWLNEEGFESTVCKIMEDSKRSNPSIKIGGIMKNIKTAVKEWVVNFRVKNARNSSMIEQQISVAESRIQNGLVSSENFSDLRKLRADLWQQYRREESELLQKSRLRWFAEGDRNSNFFHQSVLARRKINALHSLKVNNQIISKPLLVKSAVKQHFEAAYNSDSALEVLNMNLEFARISSTQANYLQSRFNEEEIKSVFFASDGNRAPGPDGFNLNFFKKYWPHLREGILDFFEDFYGGKKWGEGINHSFITLIPKVRNPSSLREYRPISLVNGLYKILSKVLAN
ncbi:hypothetical protein HRI_004909000 [Hibiscus trionum]|uniref:Endonuclease/exonuclease/phosphatase domain-containing protein n=1 Tax=Hibiscus trionum TaxID=183268 RepID=A0A9W7MP44_HIBTR|nr:hypothetical protein HRI_004909000 [Hibiscus trionum]